MRRDKKFADARAVMKRIGGNLVQERKRALSEGTDGEIGKDLLSLLVKANMTDPDGSSMSDEDVQDRKPSPGFGARPSLADAPPAATPPRFFISMQKSQLLSWLATRLAARVSHGAFTVCLTTSWRKSAYGPRFSISGQISRT